MSLYPQPANPAVIRTTTAASSLRMDSSLKVVPLNWGRRSGLQGRDAAPGEAQVFPGLGLVGKIAQQISRVIGHDERHALIAMQPPAQARDARLGVEQRLHGKAPHREDQFRLDELELAQQVGRALADLEGLRIAVARRAALEHVADVDVLAAREADRGEHVVEQATGLPHERLAPRVFLGTRRLAHQQPVRLLVAYAENRLSAGLAQAA